MIKNLLDTVKSIVNDLNAPRCCFFIFVCLFLSLFVVVCFVLIVVVAVVVVVVVFFI